MHRMRLETWTKDAHNNNNSLSSSNAHPYDTSDIHQISSMDASMCNPGVAHNRLKTNVGNVVLFQTKS